MKPYLFLVLAAAFTFTACGENKEEQQEKKDGLLSTELVNNPYSAEGVDTAAMKELPTMDFTDTVHNFGNITEGEIAVYGFEFKNNGKTPLIISTAKGSCGCTVADFPKDPIPPGGTGIINAQFNSGNREGHQEKSVSVTTNTKQSVHMLHIKADVQPAK